MSEFQTDFETRREALWTFPREWRVMYFGFFILLCVGFAALGAVEFRHIGHWVGSPFTSLTSIVIGSGTAAALLSLFLTEIWRLIVTFSTWVAEKLNENLERSRERRRQESEERERREKEALEKATRQARERGFEQGYDEGRIAGLQEAQGERPSPPSRRENGPDTN